LPASQALRKPHTIITMTQEEWGSRLISVAEVTTTRMTATIITIITTGIITIKTAGSNGIITTR
jgi:hypothetical protein